MEKTPKILAFAGSARKDSCNKKLVKIAMEGAKEAGAQVDYLDLNDYVMPVYHGDLEAEQGLPENAKKLKKLMIQYDGWLIASPEYNSSIAGYFKNVIDWISRPEKEETVSLPVFRNKVAAIMSASPSFLGGLRGLVHLRAVLENIYVMVLPNQVTVSNAYEAFDENSQLKDKTKETNVKKLSADLAKLLRKL